LESLGERLRDAIARAIGQAVSEAVHAVLNDRPAPPRPRSYDWSRDPPSHLWHEPEGRRWADESDPWADDTDDEPMRRAAPAPVKSMGLGPALLVGCEAAAWWLRRTAGRFPVLTALGVGLGAALAVVASGPWAATSVGLAGSVLGLLALTATVQSGVAALATFIGS
jgi:hypothetical protein